MKTRTTILSLILISLLPFYAARLSGQGISKNTVTEAGGEIYALSGSDLSKHVEEGSSGDLSPLISKISVLSIHVRDTLVHDSLFHFLADKLGLAVEYYPVRWLDREYAGVYTGNMFLEPCGPFSNFSYATNNFRAIFFGINCESARSLSALEEDLVSRGIGIEKDASIQVIDTSIIKQNIYLSISSGKLQNKVNEDSLGLITLENNKKGPGIEGIKEIRVGYTCDAALSKWKELMLPFIMSDDCLWKINENETVRFVKSDIMEVQSIVFRVKSLEQAKKWLSANKLLGEFNRDEVSLDKSKAFGLLILFSEKD